MAGEDAGGLNLDDVLALLREGRPEEVCAAAIVLGKLRPRDPAVVQNLRAALREGPVSARSFVMEALARQGDLAAFEELGAALLTTGTAREQAVHVLPYLGPGVLQPLLELFPRALPHQRASFARIYVRLGTREAIDALVDLLDVGEFELCKSITHSIRAHRAALLPALQDHLAQRLLVKLGGPLTDTSRIAALKALEFVGGPAAIPIVLDQLRPEHEAVVRYTALEILPRLVQAGVDADPLRAALLPLLDQPLADGPATRGAMRVLRRGLWEEGDVSRLVALARCGDPDLEIHALRTLSELPGTAAVPPLIEWLDDPDARRRGAIAASLAEMKSATEALLSTHDAAPVGSDRRVLARRILGAQLHRLDRERLDDRLRPLWTEPLTEAEVLDLVQLGASFDADYTAQRVEAQADQDLAAGRAERSVLLLEPLVRHRFASPSGRLLLALAHLMQMEPAGPLERPHHDRAMQLLAPLCRMEGFVVADRLLAETRVSADALAAVGLWFEARSEDPESLATRLRGG